MTVYIVWDFDPMDGSYGSDYLARIHATREGAQTDMDDRNKKWLSRWRAATGEDRVHETWNWRHAQVEVREVDEP